MKKYLILLFSAMFFLVGCSKQHKCIGAYTFNGYRTNETIFLNKNLTFVWATELKGSKQVYRSSGKWKVEDGKLILSSEKGYMKYKIIKVDDDNLVLSKIIRDDPEQTDGLNQWFTRQHWSYPSIN